MTRDDIIRMAREAGATVSSFHGRFVMYPDDIERFAALVAAAERKNYEHTLALQQQSYEREIKIEVEAEREACAKVCESLAGSMWVTREASLECSDAIRARGQA
jgi:hypothetical protein